MIKFGEGSSAKPAHIGSPHICRGSGLTLRRVGLLGEHNPKLGFRPMEGCLLRTFEVVIPCLTTAPGIGETI